MLSRVPQGSTWANFVQHIHKSHAFDIIKNHKFTGDGDANTLFVVTDNITHVIKALEEIRGKPFYTVFLLIK